MTSSKTKALMWLGFSQIMVAILIIAFNLVADVYDAGLYLFPICGYWCGLMYILAGSFGILASGNSRSGYATSSMAVSIVTALFTVSLIIIAILSIHWNGDSYQYWRCQDHCILGTAMHGTLIVCGFIGLALCIASGVVSSQLNVQITESMELRKLSLTPARAKVFRGLGITQLSFGATVLFLGVIDSGLMGNESPSFSTVNVGFAYGCASMYILAGCLGIAAGKKQLRGHVTSSMVLSIFSAILTPLLVYFTAARVFWGLNGLGYPNNRNCRYCAGYVVLNSIIVLLAVPECIIAIVYSAFCCAAICCKSSTRTRMAYPVVYPGGTPFNSQQGLVFMNDGGQPQYVFASGQQPVESGHPTMDFQLMQYPSQFGMVSPPAHQESNSPPAYEQPSCPEKDCASSFDGSAPI